MIPDREKVMRGLKCHAAHGFKMCSECPYYPDEIEYEDDDDLEGTVCEERLASDALALLKEQEQPVRCAECKYYGRGGNPDGFGWCGRPGAGCSLPEDYYCKYGTKKEADNG